MTTKGESIVLSDIADDLLYINDNGAIWRKARRWRNQIGSGIIQCQHRRVESLDKDGYMMLVVRDDGRQMNVRAHRVIYAYFHGGEIDDTLEVNHKDLNRSNNHPDNLELTTRTGNILHAAQNALVFGSRKLSRCAVITMRQRRAAGESYADIACDYNITPEGVSAACRGQSWA
jgi:hypothetical protein